MPISSEPVRNRLKSVNRVGARASVSDGAVVETVWMRNVGSEFGGLAAFACGRIAMYLALRKLEALTVGANA